MAEAVIVDAVRTPIAKGRATIGTLSGIHATKLQALTLRGVLEKAGVPFEDVDQVIGGCVTQAGEQAGNVIRNAWLTMGETFTPGGTSVDAQCGSAQQANHMVSAFINNGSFDCGIGCGVESMSRVKMGLNVQNGPGYFTPSDWPWDSTPDQFHAVYRIAKNRGLTREDCDAFALESQNKAKIAQAEGRFDREIMAVEVDVRDEEGNPTGETRMFDKDEGLRDSTMEGLAKLGLVNGKGVHTAGNSSQVSDGSTSILWMSAEKAKAMGLKPRARIITDVTIGADPYYLLDGPIAATELLLKKAKMNMSDIDIFEINEAFAAVVLSWAKMTNADMTKVNVNGGAIALGHPVGSTGARLFCTALHELERADKSTALISMCCGASVATGTILERL